MRSDDTLLRHDVEAQLDWDRRFDSRQIGVAVKDGVVALSGYVASYAEQRAVEEAVRSVAGVRAIANDIVVELAHDAKRSDAEIAEAVLKALGVNVAVPRDAVTLVVRDGWVTLDGQVSLWFQKNAAESCVSTLRGVRGVTNNIVIRSRASLEDVTSKIEDAFRRQAHIDAERIRVQALEGTVTLEGEVRSLQERQQAEIAAWQAPGVSQVIDKLIVRP